MLITEINVDYREIRVSDRNNIYYLLSIIFCGNWSIIDYHISYNGRFKMQVI